MPTSWRGWRLDELDVLFQHWRTGRPVCMWARDALPGRTLGSIRVTAYRAGLPSLVAVRRGQCLFSLLAEARGRAGQ